MNNRPPHPTAAAAGVDVSVSPFDASVDNFFAAIDEISALCGSTSSSPTEIQRFSSMITFLKEWRYFQYKPRTVNFVYHKEAREPVRGVNLSQFSSAAVPMEQSPEKSTTNSKDFVLYAGGPVWALDWCPRSAESSGSDIKCEYLAVAAHPPGSEYHKMGKPLIGRGIIQIWCLVNINEKDEKVESFALRTGRKSKGRPRKRPVEEEPLEISDAEDRPYVPNKRPNVAMETHDISLAKPKKKLVSGSNGPARPRGRPKNHPLPDLTNLNGQEGLASVQQCLNVDVPLAVHASNDKNAKEEPVVKKRRGRPRKYPLPDMSGIDESILGRDRVNVDLDVPLAILASDNRKVKEESASKKPRGRSRKHPLPVLTNSCGQEESASGQHCLNVASADDKGKEKWVVLKHCGSPGKNPIPYLNNSSPASGVELDKDTSTKLKHRGRPRKYPLPDVSGNDESILGQDRVNVDVRVPLAILASDDKKVKEESAAKKRRGRSRKHPLPVLTNSCGQEESASGQHCLNVPSADDKGKEKWVVLKHCGSPGKNLIPNLNNSFPASGVELDKDTSTKLPSPWGHESTPLNASSIDLKGIPLALPAFADLSGNGEMLVPRCRGKPGGKPIHDSDECVTMSSVDLKEDALELSSRKDSNNPSMKSLNANLAEDTLALVVVSNLNDKDDKSLPKKRGRPRKNPTPDVNQSVPTPGVELGAEVAAVPSQEKQSGVTVEPSYKDKMFLREAKSSLELREDALALPGTKDSNNSSMNSVNADLPEVTLVLTASTNLDDTNDKSLSKKRGRRRKNEIPIVNKLASTNLDDTNDKSLSKKRGRRRKNEIPIVNKFVPASDVEVGLGVDVSAVPSQEKQLGVTVEPNYDYHYQDRMILCDEVMPSSVANTNTTRLIVPPSIALPRVVLCLAHNGKVAWDVKWRPHTSESQEHMGYLAVLLGNGSLEVWDVPHPNTVKSLYASCCREGTDPRFMVLKPVFRCSKVKCGDKQSIPLTVEWSPSGSCDLIVAGCHDGTVALWKFYAHYPSQDTKPLLCFTADSVPIRALSWAPEASDMESANVIVTAGHEGLKFWDLRDPYRPLWEFNPVQRAILSLDWLKDPRCIILSFDDGSLRTISLLKVLSDVPVTGNNSTVTKPPGVHAHQCSSFAIWSVQMSRATGLVAYCSADGTTLRFQLTTKAIEKEPHRSPQPHFLCGSLIEEGHTLNISTPLPSTPCFDIPPSAKKSLRIYKDASRTVASYRLDTKEAQQSNSQFPALFGGDDLSIVLGHGDSQTPLEKKSAPTCSKTKKSKPNASSVALLHGDQQNKLEVFPPKIMAMHRVRWNMNKGSERWLCYGGAAGIVRCQAIGLPTKP